MTASSSATPKTYYDRWKYASFGGYQFLTDAHERKQGRRLVIHEFPGSDTSQVEDFGAMAWDGQLNAYFIGDQYDVDCATLEKALNVTGAAWLIHPWLGPLWARARTWTRRESNEANGLATLAIEFVPGGGVPTLPAPDAVDIAAAKVQDSENLVTSLFSLAKMSSSSVQTFIGAVAGQLSTLTTLVSLASLPVTFASQVISTVQGVQADLSALVALPGQYAGSIGGITDLLGSAFSGGFVTSQQVPGLVNKMMAMGADNTSTYLTGVAVTDPAVLANAEANSVLRSQLFVLGAAKLALCDYVCSADRDSALNAVLTGFDGLINAAPMPLFESFVDARTAFIAGMMAQNLTPTQTRQIVNPLPATVLAYRMGVDETVFLAENAVVHPLFVVGTVHG